MIQKIKNKVIEFKIEGLAISKTPLIQNEWNTKPQINDIIPEENRKIHGMI
jgi:hypothetical protein